MCPLGYALWHIYAFVHLSVKWGGGVTWRRADVSSTASKTIARTVGGMVQTQGLHWSVAPSLQGNTHMLHSLRSGRCTWNGSAFLQPLPQTPKVRLTPNLVKVAFNRPENRNCSMLFTMHSCDLPGSQKKTKLWAWLQSDIFIPSLEI